ncbi:MAG: glycerol-3-phosphate dehydrogenase, partial [Devosia nanyangense]|nr:glycerol-3-phosphate dehydrogenase [Devosia nanyangense]
MSETGSELGIHDIFVIGGGINGTGVARDAAGRGYSVMLAEMNDLASGTSSAATKLIHGGLRYLEHYEFRLVHEALAEREVLWSAAPHIIRPLRFVLPYQKGLRPAFVLRTGLFLYDYMGGRKLLPPTRTLDLRTDEAGKPLKPGYRTAFEYSDCWVDDARFVALNALDARERGAEMRTRTKVTSARRSQGAWTIDIEDMNTGVREAVRARMLINAAGPSMVIRGIEPSPPRTTVVVPPVTATLGTATCRLPRSMRPPSTEILSSETTGVFAAVASRTATRASFRPTPSAVPVRPAGPPSSRAERSTLTPATSISYGAARLWSANDSATSSTRAFSSATRQRRALGPAAGGGAGGACVTPGAGAAPVGGAGVTLAAGATARVGGPITRFCQFTVPSGA